MPCLSNRLCCLSYGLAVLIVGFCLVGSISAQEPAPTAAPMAKAKPAPKPAEPEVVELVTKDNVRLKLTYYAGSKGKETIPIIILHDSKTDRNAYHALALTLQRVGHAVVVPDLRGYGESTLIRKFGGKPDEEFDAKKLGTVGYGLMVTIDMEKIKSFLGDKNDEGKLNLNQLCVIGVGDLGGNVAVNWTVGDWAAQDLPIRKQSKDVHALILVSPESSFKSLSIPKWMPILGKIEGPNKKSAERMSFFFIVGGGKPGDKTKPKEWRQVKGFYDTVARLHPTYVKKEDIKADQTVFFGEMPTSLQGGDLLAPNLLKSPVAIEGFKPIPLETMILTFIDWRLAEKKDDLPWSSRALPGR